MTGLISLLVQLAMGATTYTIGVGCPGGCNYATLPAAVADYKSGIIPPGSILEMRCNEEFPGSSITWPYVPGQGRNGYTILTTSCRKQLPPYGTRVGPQHRRLMPHLYPTYPSVSIITVGGYQGQLASVDVVTNRITLGPGPPELANGDGIACRTAPGGAMPDGMLESVEYTATSVTGSAGAGFSFIPAQNGVPLDLTSVGSGNWCTPTQVGGFLLIDGISFEPVNGQPFLYSLLQLGTTEEAAVSGTPRNIDVVRSYIDSPVGQEGPRNSIAINGRWIRVEDSYLANAKQFSNESHAISMVQTPGPVLIKNNYLNAASINILTGGNDTRIRGLIVSDLTVIGNHFQKSAYMLWSSSPSVPTGACLDGRYHLQAPAGRPDSATPVVVGTPGSTYYEYRVKAMNSGSGSPWTLGYGAATGSGNATLNGVNYNTVRWSPSAGSNTYEIYRVAGGATQGKIATVVDFTAPGPGVLISYNDQGAVGNGVQPGYPSCADGGCWVCNGNVWAAQAGAQYRPETYQMKGFFESKKCLRCRFESNWEDTGFADGDVGNPGYCFFLSSYQQDTNRYIQYRNNHCQDTWTGIGAAVNYAGFAGQNSNVLIENNEVLSMGLYPQYTSEFNPGNLAQRRATFISAGYDDLTVRNNTIRGAAGMTIFAGITFSNQSAGGSQGFDYRDNIIDQGGAGIFYDALGADDCSPGGKLGQYVNTPAGRFRNNVFFGSNPGGMIPGCAFTNLGVPASVDFTNTYNSTLLTTSPYSPYCLSGCAFVGTNGRAPGVDKPTKDWETSNRVGGSPRWLTQGWSVDPGSSEALVSYIAPDPNTVCYVTLYTDFSRATLHGDVADSAKQIDNRAGNYFSGVYRIFRLGTIVPLTPNSKTYGIVTCGTQARPFELWTLPAGTGTKTFTKSFSGSTVGEYSASPGFSSPTPTSGTKHAIVASPVAFYRDSVSRKVIGYIAP